MFSWKDLLIELVILIIKIFKMLVHMLNAILFMSAFYLFFMHIASRICNLFLYIIIVLSVRIFLTLEDVSWSVLLCFIIKCYFMALFLFLTQVNM